MVKVRLDIGALCPYFSEKQRGRLMDIQPTKEHFEIIKEIGSKWVIGLATMNGALLLTILSNDSKTYNVWLSISVACFGIGAIFALFIGHNVSMMFLKYYERYEKQSHNTRVFQKKCAKEKSENTLIETMKIEERISLIKDVKEYNFKINVLKYVSIFCLAIGALAYLAGINPLYAGITLSTLAFILVGMGVILIGYNLFCLHDKSWTNIFGFIVGVLFILIVSCIVLLNL